MASCAAILEQRSASILAQWLDSARRSASARGLAGPQLTSLIAAYLATLGRGASGERPTDEQKRLLEIHLSQRLRQGFDLSEVLFEFSLLARAVRDALDAVAVGERPSEHDRALVYQELYAATDVVARIYSEHLLEDEQMEKRYARLIQDVVTRSLREANGNLPVRERLGDILALVREALHADAASLLLYDPASDRLITKASAAFGHVVLDEVAAVTGASFVGKVALEQAAVLVPDVAHTPLDLGEPLRRSGLRSLLGVRLTAAQTLVGVLYVATRAAHDFTPTEIRRLESLGDRITLHLDNAQLSARLRDKVDQLELFVDVLAHDLRGPLSVARIAAATLRDETFDRVAALNRLERSLARIERMVTDLLDAHRVAAGRELPLHVEDDFVDRVIADAIEEADVRGRPRVVVDVDGRLRGFFDPGLVRRAAWNLIVNALKYGDADAPVTVTVRGDDERFVVEVHNEGTVIAAADEKRLFKPFARGRTATQPASGWGLGLALVAGCAAAHGGSIEVHSGGEGTTFRLTIPWQHAADEQAPTVH